MEANTNKSSEALKISGDWNLQSNNLKDKFPQLTDADLKFDAGKEEVLVDRLALRLNKKRNEILNIIRKAQTAVS